MCFPFKLTFSSVLSGYCSCAADCSQQENGSMPFNSNTFDVESLIVFYNSLQFKQF